jgi:hypothetical protein
VALLIRLSDNRQGKTKRTISCWILNAQSTNGKDTARINLRARLKEEATGAYAHFLYLPTGQSLHLPKRSQ